MSTSISTSKQRSADIKLLAIITTGVLLLGFFIAGTILFLSRGTPGPCGEVNAGSLTDLVPRATTSPSFVAFGGNCQYWLALRDSRLVAIKPTIASRHCTVDWKPQTNQFSCGGKKVTFAQLQYYPTSLGTGAFKGSWIIDFGDETTTTTTTT
jgi:hypothetical protein